MMTKNQFSSLDKLTPAPSFIKLNYLKEIISNLNWQIIVCPLFEISCKFSGTNNNTSRRFTIIVEGE